MPEVNLTEQISSLQDYIRYLHAEQAAGHTHEDKDGVDQTDNDLTRAYNALGVLAGAAANGSKINQDQLDANVQETLARANQANAAADASGSTAAYNNGRLALDSRAADQNDITIAQHGRQLDQQDAAQQLAQSRLAFDQTTQQNQSDYQNRVIDLQTYQAKQLSAEQALKTELDYYNAAQQAQAEAQRTADAQAQRQVSEDTLASNERNQDLQSATTQGETVTNAVKGLYDKFTPTGLVDAYNGLLSKYDPSFQVKGLSDTLPFKPDQLMASTVQGAMQQNQGFTAPQKEAPVATPAPVAGPGNAPAAPTLSWDPKTNTWYDAQGNVTAAPGSDQPQPGQDEPLPQSMPTNDGQPGQFQAPNPNKPTDEEA